jgi:DNA-binding transcriptional MocR family regulator
MGLERSRTIRCVRGEDGGGQLLYERLADEIEGQIRRGEYRFGERLPSVRRLHAERSIAIGTAAEAFAELERRGVVEARPRSGYFAKPTQPVFDPPPIERGPMHPRPIPFDTLTDEFVTVSADPRLVPLGGAILGPELVPLKHLARAAKTVLARNPEILAKYGPPNGTIELRREIAKRMLPMGLALAVSDIVVSSGCMDAIRIAITSVTKPGDVVAVESPTFFGFLQLLREAGIRIIEVPTHPTTGMDLDLLERSLRRHSIRAALLTPNFQNPTGATMPDAHKTRLGQLARRHDFTIIEDDVYGDLHFGPQRPKPIAALVHDADIVYCSSFSKTLCAGLRVGWVVPGRHLPKASGLKLSSILASPGLNQLILADFLASGSYGRHLRRLRLALKNNMMQMARALAQSLPPGCRITSPNGGFLVWVRLADDRDGLAMYEASLREGVTIMPGRLSATSDRYRSYFRLSCGFPWTPKLEEGLRRVGDVIRRA